MIDLEEIAKDAQRLGWSQTTPTEAMACLSRMLERVAWAQEEIQRDLAWIKKKLKDEA
jgi:hypothetical protein